MDHSLEKTFCSFLAPDLLILDDFGLQRMSPQQSTELYELIIAKHRRSSFVITSNRSVEEWLGLFDDPILGNSTLDRLANPATRSPSKAPATGNASHRTKGGIDADDLKMLKIIVSIRVGQ